MSTLILKDDERLPGTIRLGWRIRVKGGHHDLFWGNTRNDITLRTLVNDPEWKHHTPITIIDEREQTKGNKPLTVPDWWNEQYI